MKFIYSHVVLLGISISLIFPQKKDSEKFYNIPVRVGVTFGFGEQKFSGIRSQDITINAYENDIFGLVFFDELDPDLLTIIQNKIPEKFRKILGATDTASLKKKRFSISARNTILDNSYSNLYYLIPRTIGYSDNSDYQLLMLNTPLMWLGWMGVHIDGSVTTIMYDDKINFDTPKWKIRPSFGISFGMNDIPPRWNISVGINYSRRHLWPWGVSFYDNKKVTLVDEKMIYLNAQKSAISFYEKLGFDSTGSMFDEVGIAHQKMIFPNS